MKTWIVTLALLSHAQAQVILLPEGIRGDYAAVAEANPSLSLVGYSDGKDALGKIAAAEGYIGSPNEALMNAGAKLRWVHIFSAGIDRYADLPKLRDDSVAITSLKIDQGPEIADHAFALLLGLTRNMAAFQRAQESGEWKRGAGGLPMTELRGKNMLVIGYGGIGVQVAERSHAFGMDVYAINPGDIPLTGTLRGSGKPDELDEFLAAADVVVSCVPETPQTIGMISAAQFAKMKPGAYLINVSRGKVVDTAALVKALDGKKIAGAGLDVTDPEPLPKDHPLWKMKNVIITPHVAGISEAKADRQKALISSNLERFSKGLPLKNAVSGRKGY
ncbi:D-2-hydroxyacid dehydrogenase [Akkermansiaceae bacterium]|nr:D-2-hydroxyacid dehydrogenase [Akkermansiaceae bacterium]